MKNILLFSFFCLFVGIDDGVINACNLCLGREGTPLLERKPLRPVECNCDCWNQPKVRLGQGKGHKCVTCGHLQKPEDVFAGTENSSSNKGLTGRTYIRYENK